MTTGAPMAELQFDPPGPGSWKLDPVHFPYPATRYWSEIHPDALMRGFSEFTRYYGMLIDGMAYCYLNGFAYSAIQPVGEDEVPARLQRAAEVFEGRLWREQLRDWDGTFKPESIERHRELQSVNPAGLSDEDLVAYLTRCRAHHAEMIYQHMRHTGAAIVPIGDLLVHAVEWAGVPPAELLAMTRGAAPVSAGASAQLARMIAAFKADSAARNLLESDRDPGEILSELRELDGEAGEAVSEYLDLTGYRLLDGFDISGRYALELPDALVRAIRAAVSGDSAEASQGEVADKIDEIRSKVPEEHRQEFDELLFEARLMYRIRDERGVFSDIWASGIMRRAVIAGGRRMAKRGRIQDPEHFVDAGFDEMVALLSGTNGPSAEELAARFSWRTSHSAKEAPATLGPPPPPPPDPSDLPDAAARMMRAVGFGLDAVFVGSTVPHEEDVLHGLAASGGVYEGPARRVSGPSEFDRIVRGDVLVTEATSEAFNILLPLLGALVTDTGGLLSHPAIVAREYGIPGVVGTRDATERIADGTRVRVNGDSGEVAVLT